MPVLDKVPDSADMARLLTLTRRRISTLATVRIALAFFSVGCIQALVLMSLACLPHGAVLLAAFMVAGAWPFAVHSFLRSRHLARPIHVSGLIGSRELLRLVGAVRWGILLSVPPAAAIVLFASVPSFGLMAVDAVVVCLIAGIWSVKWPTQKRIAWLVDQHAGLEGSLSLWLEMTATAGLDTGNPFYSLTWRRVQGRWQNVCRAATGLNSYSADQPRSTSVLIAVAGFSALAVGAGLLLADSFQSHRPSVIVGHNRVANLDGANQPVASTRLRIRSQVIHALPQSLAKRLLTGTTTDRTGSIAMRHSAQAVAEIRRDIHQRQRWKKTLNALQAALNQRLASEVGQKAGRPAFTDNRGSVTTKSAVGSPELSPNSPHTVSDRIMANLVRALHHAGLSAAGRNRILAAASGFSGRAGAGGLHNLKSAVADAHTAQLVLAREISAEKQLLAEISQHMAASAQSFQMPVVNTGGKTTSAPNDASGNLRMSRLPHSGDIGLPQSAAGGPSEKPPAGHRTNAALVDSNSLVILDKPLLGATHPPIDVVARDGGKADHAPPLFRPSVIQNKTQTPLPAGYRRLIRRYFDQ